MDDLSGPEKISMESLESDETKDRTAGQINVPELTPEQLRDLTDTELRRCLNGAENRSRFPGRFGSMGAKDFRKLIAEFKRRHPGRKPPRWKSIPPPPPNGSK